MTPFTRNHIGDDRYLLLVDTGEEEDVAQLLTIICDGNRHSSHAFDDLRAYRQAGAE